VRTARVSSGDGSSAGPSSATHTKRDAGSPSAPFPISRAHPGAAPIRRPANNSSVDTQRSNPSVTSRSRATRIRSILTGRATSRIETVTSRCTGPRRFVQHSCGSRQGTALSADRSSSARRPSNCTIGMAGISIIDERICSSSIPTVIGRYTMHQTAQRQCRVPHGALVMLERSAGKLARSVLRGPGEREPTWLPGDGYLNSGH
jgi:hypothetical protein